MKGLKKAAVLLHSKHCEGRSKKVAAAVEKVAGKKLAAAVEK